MQEHEDEDWKGKLAILMGGAILLMLIGYLCAHSCPPGYTWDPSPGKNCCVDASGNCLIVSCPPPKQIPTGGCCGGDETIIWLGAPDDCCGPAGGQCDSSCDPDDRNKPGGGCCPSDQYWNGRCECRELSRLIPSSGACCLADEHWGTTRCECNDPARLIIPNGHCCGTGTIWDDTEECCIDALGNCVTCVPPQRENPGKWCCSVDYLWNAAYPPSGRCECDPLQAPGRTMPSGACCPAGYHWDITKTPPCCADDSTGVCADPGCGDLHADGDLNLFDVLDLIKYLHHGTPLPFPEQADVDNSGVLDYDDVYYMINDVYNGGPEVCHPPSCPADAPWSNAEIKCWCIDEDRRNPDTGRCCPDGTTWDETKDPPCCIDSEGTCVGEGLWGWYCLGGGEQPPPVCGDGTCSIGECRPDCNDCDPCCGNGDVDAGETCISCPGDTGPCQPCNPPDGNCDTLLGETCVTCPQDCTDDPCCGDGTCEAAETPSSCPQDCTSCKLSGGNCDINSDCCSNICSLGTCADSPPACKPFLESGLCSPLSLCTCTSPADCCSGSCLGGYCRCVNDRSACTDSFQCCPGSICLGGVCTSCGNSACESEYGENCQTCPQDCCECGIGGTTVTAYFGIPGLITFYCGDGTCNRPFEDGDSCPSDCPIFSYCGDGFCANDNGRNKETYSTCPADCKCGDGVCSKTIEGCHLGAPWSCDSDCFCTNVCNDDGICDPWEDYQCYYYGNDCPLECGDGLCDSLEGESCSTCEADCGQCSNCGDGFCVGAEGETTATCPQDCGKCLERCEGYCDNCGDSCENRCKTNCLKSHSASYCNIICGCLPCTHSNHPCTSDVDCCMDYYCETGSTPSTSDDFCAERGSKSQCTRDRECLAGKVCSSSGWCDDYDCCGNGNCYGSAGENINTCFEDCRCKAPGRSCWHDGDCCSGDCSSSNTCTCSPALGNCYSDSDCCSNDCDETWNSCNP